MSVRQSDEIIIHPPTEKERYLSFPTIPLLTGIRTMTIFRNRRSNLCFFAIAEIRDLPPPPPPLALLKGRGGESLNERQRRRETKKNVYAGSPVKRKGACIQKKEGTRPPLSLTLFQLLQ